MQGTCSSPDHLQLLPGNICILSSSQTQQFFKHIITRCLLRTCFSDLPSAQCDCPEQPRSFGQAGVVWCEIPGGVKQQIRFLAAPSLPRKHLRWPKIWTQARCAAIPTSMKVNSKSRQFTNQRDQVYASALHSLLWRLVFKVPALKEEIAHLVAGKKYRPMLLL